MENLVTVADNRVRRVTSYGGYTGILLVASKDPRTVEEFAETHQRLAGWPMYLERRLREESILRVGLERLAQNFGLSDLDNDQVLAILRSPDYRDYHPNKRIGTGLRSRHPIREDKMFSYDSAIVVDLRTRTIYVRARVNGWQEKHLKPSKRKKEPYYTVGYISSLRNGQAHFSIDSKVRRHRYCLPNNWKIVDLRNKKVY